MTKKLVYSVSENYDLFMNSLSNFVLFKKKSDICYNFWLFASHIFVIITNKRFLQ